jgi:F0F1-type ATP synthase assembly protein I
MAARAPDPKVMGHYLALAQVGMEMVVPAGIGLWLDKTFDWRPWGVIVGAGLGLFLGMLHLIVLLGRRQDQDSTRRKPDAS